MKAKAFANATLSGPTAWLNRMKVVVYVPRLMVFLWGCRCMGNWGCALTECNMYYRIVS